MAPKKILIFAPYGSYTVHHQVDAMIGSALRMRGCEVTAVLCDGVFSHCPQAGLPPDPEKCRVCAESGKGFFSNFPIEQVQLRSLLSDSDMADIRRWAAALRPEDMEGATFEGMEVGSWTNSTLHQYILKGRLDVAEEGVAEAYRKLLLNAAIIVRGLGRVMDERKPDNLLCFSGWNAFYRVAYEIAKRKGAKPLVHERGYIDDSFVLPSSGFPHLDRNLSQAWEHWRDIPLTREECQQVRSYFEGRETGKNSNFIPFYTYTSEAEAVRRNLRIPPGAKIVGLFPSSDWEVGMSISGMELTFTSQIEWMRVTAQACREEGAFLVIRHHPNNVLPGRVTHSFIQDLLDLAREFPDNVRVVMPDEKLTSYSLVWSMDLGVSLLTTMGAEAFVRGVPTICLADFLYRHLGLEWVRDKEAYPRALKAALRGRDSITVDELKRAYRFTYLAYFRLAFRFKTFGIKNVHGVDIRLKSIDDLAPGHDEVMDRVCNHLLQGTPIHPLAGERPASAAGDEQAFLGSALSEFTEKRRRIRGIGWEPDRERNPLLSVLHVGREHGAAPGSKLEGSLSRSRHRNLEIRTVHCPSYREPSEALEILEKALDGCRGECVYVGLDCSQVDESTFSTCMDALERQEKPGFQTAAWGAWICGSDGTVRGEALTKRSIGKGFAAVAESFPALAQPFVLLSLSLWKRSALRAFVSELKSMGGASWEAMARVIFEKFTEQGNDLWRLDLPMGAIYPEEESMETPARDMAWLMELAGQTQEAEAKYRMALEKDPEDRVCLLNFARMLGRQGRGEEVRRVVSPYLARHRDDGEVTALLEETGNRGTPSAAPTAPAVRPAESWKPAGRGYSSYEEVAHLVEAIPGYLLNGQEKFLFDKVKSLPDNALIMEIGANLGRSTAAMAFACVGTGKRIYSIDTFCGNESIMELTQDFMEEWRGNLARHGLDGLATPVKGYSFDVLPNWKGPTQFDFTFIDASHEYVDVVKDFQLVYPMIKTGGWMAFHDVEPGWPGPWRAWLEYGKALLTDHEAVATLACGRKARELPFANLDRHHADFSFARSYVDYLKDLFKGGAAALTDAMEMSLDGRYGSAAEKDALHSAELMLGGMPADVPFRTTLRSMLSKDASLDGHLLLWNAMTLMAESRWEEAYRAMLHSTRVSRPIPVERIKGYCQVLREKLGPAGKALPEPGAPTINAVSENGSGGGQSAGHYGQDYFNWQKHIGAFGGVANLFKFREFIRPTDTVVDLGSGGGFLLHNLDCARKMGVEINPAARRESSLHAGIDTVETPADLPDAFADTVVSNHALEHMFSPLDTLKSLLPKLKVGGRLVLVVPVDPPSQEWDPTDINKHLYTWNPMTLGNLVSLAGYKVHKVETIQHQWPPDFMEVYRRLGEDGFHQACREQARRTGNHQVRVVAVREAKEADPSHRFHAARDVQPAVSDIPVVLMAYRRPEHTAKVLKALEGLGARNLYVYSDGPKSDADRADVERTRGLFRSLPWAKLKYEESRENRGLARSIMLAADQVLEQNEHMVLLEDDCVPQRHFMDYMARCLDRYAGEEKVYGISGYSIPLPEDIRRRQKEDVYFFPRIGSWGWATWRRAWRHLDRDLGSVYRRIKDQGVDINQGGTDIQPMVESMLRGQLKDVWTLNWVLSVYARGGVFAYPRESHVQNIGFDGTGVHCGATAKYDTVMAQEFQARLPQDVAVDPAIARHFRSFYEQG